MFLEVAIKRRFLILLIEDGVFGKVGSRIIFNNLILKHLDFISNCKFQITN